MRNQTQELNTSIHFLCLIHHKWSIITDKVWFNTKEGLTFIYDKNLWNIFCLSISRETIYILNILFLNMLGTDDSDLSYLLVQTSALFARNECPNMELVGTDARLLWVFSLLPKEARFDGRPGLLTWTGLFACIKAFPRVVENFYK